MKNLRYLVFTIAFVMGAGSAMAASGTTSSVQVDELYNHYGGYLFVTMTGQSGTGCNVNGVFFYDAAATGNSQAFHDVFLSMLMSGKLSGNAARILWNGCQTAWWGTSYPKIEKVYLD